MSGIVESAKGLIGLETQAERSAERAGEAQFGKIGEAVAGIESQQAMTDRLLGGGLTLARRDLRAGQAGGEAAFREGQAGNVSALLRGQSQFGAQVSPFAEAGREALQQQQALLGLGTQREQAAARAGLTESPGQQFIRERAEKSLLRNQAAIGGLGGGNVRRALVEQGAGFAAQLEGTQFDRLGQLARAGQTAATNIGQAGLTTASGIGQGAQRAAAGIGQGAFGTGERLAQATLGTAGQRAQFGQQAAANVGNLLTQQGQARASGILGSQQARAGAQGQGAELLSAGLSFFSDPKLKSNKKIIGTKNGHNIWSWTWNELAEKIGVFGNDTGVMANEVKEKNPEAVSMRDGFMTVNYSMIGV